MNWIQTDELNWSVGLLVLLTDVHYLNLTECAVACVSVYSCEKIFHNLILKLAVIGFNIKLLVKKVTLDLSFPQSAIKPIIKLKTLKADRPLPWTRVECSMVCTSASYNKVLCLDVFPVKSSYFYVGYVSSLLNFTAVYLILRCMALLHADL